MGETDKDRQKKIILVLLFLLLLGGLFYFFLNQEDVPPAAQLPRPNIGEVTHAQPDPVSGAPAMESPQPAPPSDLPSQEALAPQADTGVGAPADTAQALPPQPIEVPVPAKEVVKTPPSTVPSGSVAKKARPGGGSGPARAHSQPRPKKSAETSSPLTGTTEESWNAAPGESGSETASTDEDADAVEELEQSELSSAPNEDSLDSATNAEVEEGQTRLETDTLLAQNERKSGDDRAAETGETADEGERTKLLVAENDGSGGGNTPEDSEDGESDSASSAVSEAAGSSQEDWVGDFHADAIHLMPLLQIGQLTALPSFTTVTDTVNASANFGVGFDWSRRWSKRIQTEVFLQYLSYQYTAGSRTLTNETGGLFGGGLAASYFLKKGFDVSLRLRFSQELFYRVTTLTSATLDQAMLVFPGIGAGYSMHLSKGDLIRVSGSVDFGLPNRLNGYTINTFMNYQIRAGYETNALGFHLGGDLGFRMDDVSTSIGTQVWTGFEGRLKAGLSF